MLIYRNVNGIRAMTKKVDFAEFLSTHDPDVIGLCETKIDESFLPKVTKLITHSEASNASVDCFHHFDIV